MATETEESAFVARTYPVPECLVPFGFVFERYFTYTDGGLCRSFILPVGELELYVNWRTGSRDGDNICWLFLADSEESIKLAKAESLEELLPRIEKMVVALA